MKKSKKSKALVVVISVLLVCLTVIMDLMNSLPVAVQPVMRRLQTI